MNVYAMKIEELDSSLSEKITIVDGVIELNQYLAKLFADQLEEKMSKRKMLTVICPVGPLNYEYFAEEVLRRQLSCRNLRTINMDEYLDDNDRMIGPDHPLSFRKFMEKTFFSHLPDDKRPLPENIIFPDPDKPGKVTELIDSIGGADVCWAGFGITGHLAFNDPPQMIGEPEDLESFSNCRTRKITICPMATAQMAMGGTNGNLDILPARAVTLGMYELLKTKKFYLTFMRNWHAGLWRKALMGPVTSSFPGSLLQGHPNLSVVMTKLASRLPVVNITQANGEKK